MNGERVSVSEYFYLFDEVKDNAVFFQDGKTTLKDNEILISIDDLKNEYFREEFFAADKEQSESFINAFRALLGGNPQEDNYRDTCLKPFLNTINGIQNSHTSLINRVVKPLNLKGFDKDTSNCLTDETLNVVGFYYGIETDAVTSNYYLKFNSPVLSTEGMDLIKIDREQGIYSKIITPLFKNRTGEKVIGKMMDNSDGIELNWYKNSVLELVATDRERVSEVLTLFLYISVALTVFSVFLLFNYISVSILSKKQSIGVLRALGANTKNIFVMFLAESLIISLIIGVFATFGGWFGCLFVNDYLVNVMNFSLNVAMFSERQIVLIVFGSIFAGVLSSIIPIVKVAKEKPVHLIRLT